MEDNATKLRPSRQTSRAENLRINHAEFNNGATELESLPPVLFVELTQNCNLQCRMCRSSAGYQPSLNMSSSLFDLLRCELFPFASLVDLRGWGESTVLRDLGDRIAQTALAGPRLRLVTNALSLSPPVWKLLMDAGASVFVSVDASSPETMRALGRGSFKVLVRSLDSGAQARDASLGKGTISFNTVITSLSLSELPEIVRMAARYNVRRVIAFPVVAARSNPLHLHNRKADIPTCVRDAEVIARKLKVELRLGASLHEEFVVAEGLPIRCSHPWEYCYIDYAGNVGYCDHLIGHSGLVLGSLSNSSFEEIWNGPRFQKLRHLHAEARHQRPGKLASEYPHCAWCYERRYVDFEDETNPQAEQRAVSTLNSYPLLVNTPGPFKQTDFLTARKLP